MESKVFSMGDNSQWCVVKVVGYLNGVGFIVDSQHLTFVWVEFLVFSLLCLEGIEVSLKG